MPLVDSMNRTNRNLCVLRDGLKIISDRQKESKKELVETISSKLEALPANNANVIWLERNVWAGNKDGIRHCQQFVINYEDSIRRRYQMEIEAQQREQKGQRLMRESDSIRKRLK